MNRNPRMRRSGTPMIREEGIIEQATPARAFVRIQRSSCCKGCSSQGSCEAAEENKEMRLEVANTLQAKVGDRVEISVPTRSLLKLSFLVYFCPILALVIGAFGGELWGQAHGIQSSLLSILTGAAAMAVVYGALRWFDRFAKAKEDYSPSMTRVLSSAALLRSDDNRSVRTGDTASLR